MHAPKNGAARRHFTSTHLVQLFIASLLIYNTSISIFFFKFTVDYVSGNFEKLKFVYFQMQSMKPIVRSYDNDEDDDDDSGDDYNTEKKVSHE